MLGEMESDISGITGNADQSTGKLTHALQEITTLTGKIEGLMDSREYSQFPGLRCRLTGDHVR